HRGRRGGRGRGARAAAEQGGEDEEGGGQSRRGAVRMTAGTGSIRHPPMIISARDRRGPAMRHLRPVLMNHVLALALGATPLFAAAQEAPGAMPAAGSDACTVWARESAFAQSVADHDAAAFASFLHPDAVFVGGQGPTRGAEAITAEWAGLIAGKGVLLR